MDQLKKSQFVEYKLQEAFEFCCHLFAEELTCKEFFISRNFNFSFVLGYGDVC